MKRPSKHWHEKRRARQLRRFPPKPLGWSLWLSPNLWGNGYEIHRVPMVPDADFNHAFDILKRAWTGEGAPVPPGYGTDILIMDPPRIGMFGYQSTAEECEAKADMFMRATGQR